MIRINLLVPEIHITQTRINPTIPAGIAAVAVLGVLSIIHVNKISEKNKLLEEIEGKKKEIEYYKPIIAQVDALEQARTALQNRKMVIQQLESERLRYPLFMDDFLKLLPANVWLLNLTTTLQGEGMTVGMDVMALDNYAIADLVSNLETSQVFTDVDLGGISVGQTATGQTLSFHINMVYKRAATNAPKKS